MLKHIKLKFTVKIRIFGGREVNRKLVGLIMLLILAVCIFTGCGGKTNVGEGETWVITDSCGRDVEIPVDVDRIAPSGATSEMVLMTIAPEMLVGLSSTPSKDQMKYYPEEMWTLPTFGQFYGSKANLNMEALIAADPQIIIDIGDKKDTHKQDMNTIQRQTGIPTVFVEATLDTFPEAYRTLGKILGKEEAGEKLAAYVENTVAEVRANAALIPESERKTVYYGTGSAGLNANASGSIQSDVIDTIGAVNAIQVPEDEITNSGGGTLVNMEELYISDPDVIVLTTGGPYKDAKKKSSGWSGLRAVKNDDYYEIPNLPYCWMSGPPSINRVLGLWWLGNLVYPEFYDYDMVEKAKEFYSLFWNHELSDEEAEEMLANSTLK